MKKLLLFILIFASELWAGSRPGDILFRWNRTPVHHVAETEVSIQILERFMLLGPKSYGIGTITLTKASKDPDSISTIVSDLKKETGFTHKRTFDFEGVTFVEMEWAKGNRQLRYAISDIGDYRLISLASYRPGYAKISSPESAAIQVKWHQHEMKMGRRTSMILLDSIFPAAHAQMGTLPGFDFSPILNSISGSDIGAANLSGGATTIDHNFNINVDGRVDVSGNVDINVNGLGEPIDRLGDIADRNIGRVGDIAGESLSEVDRIATDQLAHADRIIGDTISETERIASENMDRIDANIDQAMAQADETTKMVDKNWSETNKQFEEANKVAAKLADPKHAFLLAGASAAGAVIGSTVASLAVQGVVKGLDWLVEQITDAKGKDERWRLFREAREKWEETMGNARNLEMSIDQFLLFNDVIKTIRERLPEPEKSNLTIENVIAQFGQEVLLKKKRRDQLYQRFLTTENPSCEAELAIQIQQMDGLINNMGMVMGHLQDHKKSNPGANIFDDRFFCDQLGSMLKNLVDAESSLQRYRMLMVAGQTEWREQALNDFEDLRGRTHDFNKRQDGDYESRERKQISNRYETNLSGMKRQFRMACEAQKETSYRNCYDSKWNSSDAQAQRTRWEEARDSEQQALRERSEYRSQNPLGLNTDVEAQRLERYREWFQELEDQQFCNQNPNDARCLELNQFRFNGVFYTKDRAFDRMSEVCPGRELSLPSITARKAEEARLAALAKAKAQGRTPTAKKESGGFFAAIGDFFKGIFGAIADFFGMGKKATIGEAPTKDIAIPSGAESFAIVDGERMPNRRRIIAVTPALKNEGEQARDYVAKFASAQMSATDVVNSLQLEEAMSGVSPEFATKFSADFATFTEKTLREGDAQALERAIKQMKGLKELSEIERDTLIGSIYSPEAMPKFFHQTFVSAWNQGTSPKEMMNLLALSSPMVGLGFEWPQEKEGLIPELNRVTGVNASAQGISINMGLIAAKHYNQELFELLFEIKQAGANQLALSPLLEKLKNHFTN